MAQFDVEVCRIAYQHKTIRVTAETAEEAGQKALDQAGNYVYNEKHAEYELNGEPQRVEPTEGR